VVVAGAVEQDGVTETDLRKHKKQRGGGAEGKSEADYFLSPSVFLSTSRLFPFSPGPLSSRSLLLYPFDHLVTVWD